jgi:folate-binding protein YgfZ
MVAVLRLLRAGPRSEDGFLMDLAPACRNAALEHLRKFVPPRLATLHDDSSASGMLTLLGVGAAERLASLTGDTLDAARLSAMQEGDLLHVTSDVGQLTAVRTAEVATPAFDVIAPAVWIASTRDALAVEGVPAVGDSTWDVLRVEAGWPEYGTDMDEATIPVEAGIHPRVVDYQKGCFTGQEVLIRIRDRGHVNRVLRGLRFGDVAPPAPGSELFRPGEERTVGQVTSAVRSPRFGEVIGLGYVRREVSPPAELRLGSPGGAPVSVASLQERWSPAAGST